MIRDSMFDLCKNIQKNDWFSEVASLIRELMMINEIDGKLVYISPHGGLGSVAAHLRKQLWGYLFIDDYYEQLPIHPIYSIKSHFSNDERFLLESAFNSFELIPELVANTLKSKFNYADGLIDPYKLLRPITLKASSESLIPESNMEQLIQSFIDSRIVDFLLSTETNKELNKISPNSIVDLAQVLEKDINESVNKGPSNSIKEYSSNIRDRRLDTPTLIFALSVLFYSLRNSINIIYHMMYTSLLGGDLIVLDSNSIYSFGSRQSNILFEKQSVFSTQTPLSPTGTSVGEIALVDCDLKDSHIHDFGLIHELTTQFAGEFGNNSEFKLLYVDEDLDYIQHLTNLIIEYL